MIWPHQCCSCSFLTSEVADSPSTNKKGIAPGRMNRVEKGFEATLWFFFRRMDDDGQYRGNAAQRERLLDDVFAPPPQEQSQSHEPLAAQKHSAIARTT